MIVITHDLYAQFPLREIALFDGFVQVLGGVVKVFALHILGFLLSQVLDSLLERFPVVFHQHANAFLVDPFIGIYPDPCICR